jgi:hypothetical protein
MQIDAAITEIPPDGCVSGWDVADVCPPRGDAAVRSRAIAEVAAVWPLDEDAIERYRHNLVSG